MVSWPRPGKGRAGCVNVGMFCLKPPECYSRDILLPVPPRRTSEKQVALDLPAPQIIVAVPCSEGRVPPQLWGPPSSEICLGGQANPACGRLTPGCDLTELPARSAKQRTRVNPRGLSTEVPLDADVGSTSPFHTVLSQPQPLQLIRTVQIQVALRLDLRLGPDELGAPGWRDSASPASPCPAWWVG